ncbi:NAD-dependent epimerase/dehydratase family protein [Planctomyces sp. SH-PL62]|uniref:NAD-dependent epimerase/dehydratase family protein n=1 Tax=Planctomyces sp. SH-PL62 TaxID=1636152 RepID=UPI00078D789D|nr:NAD-dependent epimerase/dehydratase family protein [Planctomyces sp. SH-PL62]AMV39834.1 GDP-6-deoxy-D-mannose reductase [Planctomyces sp. SH-PL62]
MATWLITGARGWLGGYVLDALERASGTGDRIVVLGRSRPESLRGVLFVSADLREPEGLARAVREIEPDYVVHAAGKTPPAPDAELYETNFWGTDRLLSALRTLDRPVRVVVAGSAAELGPVAAADLPVVEDHPCRPMTAYGRSKMMATASALADRGPLEVVVGRLFNPIGPGMPESLAFGRFAAQLASPAADPVPLLAGRLDARRDFVDVRDAARALIELARRGTPRRVYNIGSGRSRTIREGLDLLVRLSGRSARVEVDPDATRRREPDDSRACIDRIAGEIGWRPSTTFERSMEDLWAAVAPRGCTVLPLTA